MLDKRVREALWVIMVALCLIFPFRSRAESTDSSERVDIQEKANMNMTIPQKLTLTVGKSIIVESPHKVKRVSLADPAVADALVITPQQIYLTGKAAGVTSLTFWNDEVWNHEERVSDVFDLEVVPDISRLKEKLHEMFPREENIRVAATHDSLSLSGTVSSAACLSEVLALAESYAPRGQGGQSRVNNFLEVGGVHQVMLDVRIAEMSRSIGKKLGINFNTVNKTGKQFWISTLDNLSTISDLSPTENFKDKRLQLSSSINAIFRLYADEVPWTFLIDALKEQGLVKILAEPTLITLSGKSANFLAGGEYPIPVPQQDGIAIEYKKFGVGLEFTPTVLSSGKINMEVTPESSELDFTNALAYAGFIVPSLTTRRVSTMIELGDGQSFAIAGLLKNDAREIVRKFPLLGDIPILGSLFRSSLFQKNETELIIIVTPHLVKPLDLARQTLPTDEYIEPDDFEFYLEGAMEGRGEGPSAANHSDLPSILPRIEGEVMSGGSGLEGNFGHIQP
ncbi:MAG: type II and III secretion system protein family protein [bacterium]